MLKTAALFTLATIVFQAEGGYPTAYAAAIDAPSTQPAQARPNDYTSPQFKNVMTGSYDLIKNGANIYLVTLTAHTTLPEVRVNEVVHSSYEQVELAVTKTLRGTEQKTLSLKVQTTNYYGGRGGGTDTSGLAWRDLPNYHIAAALIVAIPAHPEIRPGTVQPQGLVDSVTGEDDPKVTIWKQLISLTELKPELRAKALLAAAHFPDARLYDYLTGAAVEVLRLAPEKRTQPGVLTTSESLALLDAMLLHAATEPPPLMPNWGVEDMATLAGLAGATVSDKVEAVKALSSAVGSSDKNLYAAAVMELSSIITQLDPSNEAFGPRKLLTPEAREQLAANLDMRKGGGGTPAEANRRLAGWLEGKSIK